MTSRGAKPTPKIARGTSTHCREGTPDNGLRKTSNPGPSSLTIERHTGNHSISSDYRRVIPKSLYESTNRETNKHIARDRNGIIWQKFDLSPSAL